MSDGSKLGQQAVTLPTGASAARPGTPSVGDVRFNTDLNQAEVWNGSQWGGMGGAQSGAFYLNNTVISNSYTIPTNQNAMTAGPVTIADGVTITISDGSTWTVV
jgi:hypothetical protein